MIRFKKALVATTLATPLVLGFADKALAENMQEKPEATYEFQDKVFSTADYPIYTSDQDDINQMKDTSNTSIAIIASFWVSMFVAGCVVVHRSHKSDNNQIQLQDDSELVRLFKIPEQPIGPEDDPDFWPPKELNS